jgi:hypothetical protein
VASHPTGTALPPGLGTPLALVHPTPQPTHPPTDTPPTLASSSLKVVAMETESNTASTATLASRFCSFSGMPSLSKVASSSGSTCGCEGAGRRRQAGHVGRSPTANKNGATAPARFGHRNPGTSRLGLLPP